MADDVTCGHDGCDCVVVGEEQYCSMYCQEANSNDVTDMPCDCGHDACR